MYSKDLQTISLVDETKARYKPGQPFTSLHLFLSVVGAAVHSIFQPCQPRDKTLKFVLDVLGLLRVFVSRVDELPDRNELRNG